MGTHMWASSDFYKRAILYLSSNADTLAICSTIPADSTEASKIGTTCMLGKTDTGVGALFSAPASTTNGWVTNSSQHTGVTISTSGTARCVAVLSGTSELIYVTSCADKNLTTADTATIPSFGVRIADPTSS